MTAKYPGPFPSWDVRKILRAWKEPTSDLVSICAHRGASHEGGTENSLNAFARAAQEGWETIEIDVRLTKDGEVVVFHDVGLGRLTNVPVPPGENQYNPFTGEGYNPPVSGIDWKDLKQLRLRDGYGRVSEDRPILLRELLSFICEKGISILVQFDLKEPAVVEPAVDIVWDYTNKDGVNSSEWCVFKPRSDWYPTPEVWEQMSGIKSAIERGLNLPPVTPLYEVSEGHSIENMKAWATRDYFVGYEIALQYPEGAFQESVDFIKSTESLAKGHGGWFIGSDLPRGYFNGERTVWDDSSVREAILAEGPDMPCQFVENVGARKPGQIPFGKGKVVDLRTRLEYVVAVGNNYFIADTHTDVHADLALRGLRNTARMLKTRES